MVSRKTLSDAVTEQSPVRKSNAEIREDISEQLLGIIKDLAIEVRPQLRREFGIELDSDLDADIGLGSLARGLQGPSTRRTDSRRGNTSRSS
jgi:hypothetical protein